MSAVPSLRTSGFLEPTRSLSDSLRSALPQKLPKDSSCESGEGDFESPISPQRPIRLPQNAGAFGWRPVCSGRTRCRCRRRRWLLDGPAVGRTTDLAGRTPRRALRILRLRLRLRLGLLRRASLPTRNSRAVGAGLDVLVLEPTGIDRRPLWLLGLRRRLRLRGALLPARNLRAVGAGLGVLVLEPAGVDGRALRHQPATGAPCVFKAARAAVWIGANRSIAGANLHARRRA